MREESLDVDRAMLPTRIEWALFLAAYSSYEAELVGLTFPPGSSKDAPQALVKLKPPITQEIADYDEMQSFSWRLKDLRDEFAHGGGNLNHTLRGAEVVPTARRGVQHFLDTNRLTVIDYGLGLHLSFAQGQFEAFITEMKQIMFVVRTAANYA